MVIANIPPNQTLPPVQPVQRGEIRQSKLDDSRARRDYSRRLDTDRSEPATPLPEPSEREISEAVRRANRSLEWAKRHFEYSVHEQTNTFMVRVYDSETEELIREIPPERILDMVARLWEVAGLIVDERV